MLWVAAGKGFQIRRSEFPDQLDLSEVRLRLEFGAGRAGSPLVSRSTYGDTAMNLTSFAKWQPRDEGGRFVQAAVDSAIEAGVVEWANRVFETSQELVPVDKGDLKASGHVEVKQVGKQILASVVYDSEHSVFVEFGTGQRGAESAGAGDGPYSANWPGMPAQPYLRPAYDQHRGEAEGILKETVAVALK